MEEKKNYSRPALKALLVYPLGPTLQTISLGISGEYATGGGDVKEERPFDTGLRQQRNLWDEVW